MLLKLKGQDHVFNLKIIRSIKIENASVVIEYAENNNLTLACNSAQEAKQLFDNIVNQIAQYHPPLLEAEP